MNKFFIVLLTLFLLSCSLPGGYVQPQISEPHATITNANPKAKSQFNWSDSFIHFIDGIEVPYKLPWNKATTDMTIRVPPGEHWFLARTEYSRSFSEGGPWLEFILIKAEIVTGKHYQLEVEVTDDGASAWLLDVAADRRVSTIVKRGDPISQQASPLGP